MELRMLHKLHRVPGYDLGTPRSPRCDVLAMGTLNGARSLGFAASSARSAGHEGDAILVGLDRVLEDPWLTRET